MLNNYYKEFEDRIKTFFENWYNIMKFQLIALGLAATLIAWLNSISLVLAIPATLYTRDSGSRINIRSSPTTQSLALHYGLSGDNVEVSREVKGESGYTWYYVKFSKSGAQGWVRGDLIRLQVNDMLDLIGRIDSYGPNYETLCPHGFAGILLNDSYIGMQCDRHDGIYLALEQIIGREANGRVVTQFVNVMQVPRNSSEEFILPSNYCKDKTLGGYSRNLFPLVRDTSSEEYQVLQVWKANLSTRQFESLSPQEISQIVCQKVFVD